ncbi:MAG: hypothetical protein ABH860_04665, partial [bacterium]
FDHEFMFNRIRQFTIESAERGCIEISFLAVLKEFKDPAERQQLFEKFRDHYIKCFKVICEKREEVKALIRVYYGEEAVEIFESNLAEDIDLWLKKLYEITVKLG